MGFDVVHLNLHKTFSTPHGGGGPGAGPVGVKERLRPFLPVPYVEAGAAKAVRACRSTGRRRIGRVALSRATSACCCAPTRTCATAARDGLPQVGKHAVLNAAYVLKRLAKTYRRPMAAPCMHEFILQPTDEMLAKGVRTLHIAKRLIDYGYHPPTIYFPLVVKEAMMIEPTETREQSDAGRFLRGDGEDRGRGAGDAGSGASTRRTPRRWAEWTRRRRRRDLDLRFCGCE